MPQINHQSRLQILNSKLGFHCYSGLDPSLAQPLGLVEPLNCTQPNSGAGAVFGPLDSDRTARIYVPLRRLDHFTAAGSKSDGSAPSSSSRHRSRTLSLRHGQRNGRAASSHLLAVVNGSLCVAFNALVRPPSEVHSSPAPIALVSLGRPEHPRHSEPLLSSSSAT